MIDKTKVIVGIVLFLNIVIIWLPTQFQTTAIQEEWRIRARYDGNIDTYNDIDISTDEIYQSRPVIGIINQLAYLLTPDSFLSHHLILISLLFIKGLVLFLVIQSLLPDYPLWAYLCTVLFIIYPSDPGVVSLRILHYHLTITLILLAVYFLIQYYHRGKQRYVVLMWISQLIAGLTLEIGYPIFFFAPLILVLLEQRISRRVIIATILFYIVPFLTFVFSAVTILVLNVSFQSTAIESYTLTEHLRHIYDLYMHNLLHAWQNIVEYIVTQATPSDWLVFALTTATIWIGSILMLRQMKPAQTASSVAVKMFVMLVGAGIVILLGYITYLPSRTHVNTDYRVYLLASVGAATFFGTTMYLIYHTIPKYIIGYFVLLGFSGIIGLTSVFAHKTHQEYLIISRQQESVARQISTSIPAFRDEAYIAIKMPSNGVYQRLPIGEIQKPVLFTPMLQYIYNDYENIQGGIICFTDYLSCNFESAGMTITASNFTNIPTPVSYAHLIIFDIDKAGNLTLIEQDDSLPGYNPLQLIDTSAPPPRRIQTIFGES